jgi:hypothetical protein
VKRPFYGTAKNSIDLEGQYPTLISTDVDDKTLDRLLTTAEGVLELQGAAADQQPGVARELIRQSSYMIVYDPQTGLFLRSDAFL